MSFSSSQPDETQASPSVAPDVTPAVARRAAPEAHDVVIAGDAAGVRDEVRAVLGARSYAVREVTTGPMLMAAVAEQPPDLVVCDSQIGQMGGMAITRELRLEESGGRLPHIPVLLLLDRRPDVFLARRSQAEGFLVKPLDPIRLRRAVTALVDGGTFEDDAYRPVTSTAGASLPVE